MPLGAKKLAKGDSGGWGMGQKVWLMANNLEINKICRTTKHFT